MPRILAAVRQPSVKTGMLEDGSKLPTIDTFFKTKEAPPEPPKRGRPRGSTKAKCPRSVVVLWLLHQRPPPPCRMWVLLGVACATLRPVMRISPHRKTWGLWCCWSRKSRCRRRRNRERNLCRPRGSTWQLHHNDRERLHEPERMDRIGSKGGCRNMPNAGDSRSSRLVGAVAARIFGFQII